MSPETVPHARLIILPDVGPVVQNTVPDLVVREIEGMIANADTRSEAAMR